MAVERAEEHSVTVVSKVSDLGRYRLIAELARGGMGIVYLALVRGPGGFNKLFVVKELKGHLSEDPNLVRMFLEEARLAAKLNHPNVVQTMEVGSEGNRHFIAMEYLDGQPLNRATSRTRKTGHPFPVHYALHVLSHMLEGLHYAHSASDFDGTRMKLVHRDVSPHNVFVTYDGQVKILDFGIAKALDSTSDTRTGVLKGKVSYMAPEQASGQPLDRRADVFSAGVMLFEAVTGERFWGPAQNDLQILHALANGMIARPRSAKPDIDAEVERIILKATAIERDDRYASAAEMQADLEAYVKELDVPSFGGRDVGKLFSGMFASDRARISQVIDDQLRTLRGTVSGEYGMIDLPRLTHSMAPSGTPSGVLLIRPDGGGSLDAPAPASQNPTIYEGTYRPAFGAAAKNGAGLGRGKSVAIVATLGALALAAGLGFVALRRPPPPRPAATASVPRDTSSAMAPPSPAPAKEPIHVAVTASPAEATISLDGRAPRTGPLRAELPRDATAHTLRIEAPKHEPKSLAFSADEDRAFDVSLEPVKETTTTPSPVTHIYARHESAPAVSPPPSPVQNVAPPPTPTPQTPAAQPTSHVRQQIDTKDPYSQ